MSFSIQRIGRGSLNIDPAGRSLPYGDRRYAIYKFSRELHPDTAAEAPREFHDLLAELEAGVQDVSGDDPSIGVSDMPPKSSACILASSRFGRHNIPICARGPLEFRCGFRNGERLHGVSTGAADILAPALSAVMHRRYNTKPGPKLESPDDESQRLLREDAVAHQARERQLATQKQEAVVTEIAAILSNGEPAPADRQRGERLLALLAAHFGLTAT